MKQLSRESFDRAGQFLRTEARPVDRALFEFRFEGAAPESVTAELAQFQNDDGGFGHALEPDLRTPSSSALATNIGLRILKELGCSADHPMAGRAVQFLLATFDSESKTWRAAPSDTNAHPHAWWWHDEDGSLARAFHDFYIIPRAEIVGLFHHFSAIVPGDWLDDVTEQTVRDIEEQAPSSGDELIWALKLAESEAVPSHLRQRLIPHLRAVTPALVARDPQQWQEYCTPPLWVAPSPQSIVADILRRDVQVHLDYQIDKQTPEGAWEPFWTWGDAYPDVWERAKREWSGHLTLETLTALHAYGRIEGRPMS